MYSVSPEPGLPVSRLAPRPACGSSHQLRHHAAHRRLLSAPASPGSRGYLTSGWRRSDKGAALTHDAKSLRRCRALDVEGLAMLHSIAIQRHQPTGAPSFGAMTKGVGGYESDLDLEINLGLDPRFTGRR